MKKAVIKMLIAVMAVVMAVGMCVGLTACNKDEVITVGYTIYEPMNYEDANGNLIGFDTDLAKAVFEELGYKVTFKEIVWDKKYVDLNAGTITCIWNGFTSNSSDDNVPRSEIVDFSYNYMLNAQAVVINSADAATLTSADAFKDKIGYVEAESAGDGYAKATLTGAIIRPATKQSDAIMQVKSGAASFAVVDYQYANSIVGKGDYANLTMVNSLKSEEEFYAIGFKKGSELTAKVNEVLEKFAKDGTITKIATKYNVQTSVITDFSDQKK